MVSLLLAVIYAAFISLGLPDALLGSAWPIMHAQMQVPLSYAGIVTFIICAGGVVIGHKFGAKFKSKAELLGGIVLVIIGLKLLIEGLLEGIVK